MITKIKDKIEKDSNEKGEYSNCLFHKHLIFDKTTREGQRERGKLSFNILS